MEKRDEKEGIYYFLSDYCLFIILLQSNRIFCASPAEEFPEAKFTLPAPDSPDAQKYLGLKAMEPFKVSDIKAKLVVIEFMNAFCPFCLANAPIINNIHKTIQGDSRLADVKVIAIASGNEKAEVDAYKKKFKTPFPVLLDQDFAISASMDGVPTPTTMIVSTENGKVLFSHTGVIKDPDRFLKELKTLHKSK
jgi:thiol-disulfide isomerase/thioredoxin